MITYRKIAYEKEEIHMIKNIKKTVIAGALALAMVGTAVPVTANAATVNKSGS